MFQKGLTVFISLFFLVSCAGQKVNIEAHTVYDTPVKDQNDQYLVGPGDELAIFYHVPSGSQNGDYLIGNEDVLKIELYEYPDLNRELTVRPDGKITLPIIGDVMAAGAAPNELGRLIANLYSKNFNNPSVTVTVVKFNAAIRRITADLTSTQLGSQIRVLVRPDGYLSLPLIDDVPVAGLTLPQVKSMLEEKYKEKVSNLEVSILLNAMKNNVAYVMGEVRKPGLYLMDVPTTVTQLLARAGGYLDSAELESILVINRTEDRKPSGNIINIEKTISEGNLNYDTWIKQYDIVYVPKSKIARADLFVDQYINSLIPSLFRLNVTYGYDLHDN